MNKPKMVRVILTLAVASGLLVACVTSTPVSPAPLPPAEESALGCALLGEWQLVAIDGQPETMVDQRWSFSADGTGVYTQNPGTGPGSGMIPSARREFQWTLDGRNIRLTQGNETVYRADDFSDQQMTWFNYTLSDVYTVERSAPPAAPCVP